MLLYLYRNRVLDCFPLIRCRRVVARLFSSHSITVAPVESIHDARSYKETDARSD